MRLFVLVVMAMSPAVTWPVGVGVRFRDSMGGVMDMARADSMVMASWVASESARVERGMRVREAAVKDRVKVERKVKAKAALVRRGVVLGEFFRQRGMG